MTETYSYNGIRNDHGTDVLKEVRRLESISKKKGRYVSHLRFHLQCKHLELTPKGLKLKSPVTGDAARKIIEKALLNVRISEIVKKKEFLEKRRIEITEDLKTKLPENIYEKITELNEKRTETEMKKSHH